MNSFIARIDGGAISTRFLSRQFQVGEQVAVYDHKTFMQSATDVAKGDVTDAVFGIAFRHHAFVRVVKGRVGTHFNMLRDQAHAVHFGVFVLQMCFDGFVNLANHVLKYTM